MRRWGQVAANCLVCIVSRNLQSWGRRPEPEALKYICMYVYIHIHVQVYIDDITIVSTYESPKPYEDFKTIGPSIQSLKWSQP